MNDPAPARPRLSGATRRRKFVTSRLLLRTLADGSITGAVAGRDLVSVRRLLAGVFPAQLPMTAATPAEVEPAAGEIQPGGVEASAAPANPAFDFDSGQPGAEPGRQCGVPPVPCPPAPQFAPVAEFVAARTERVGHEAWTLCRDLRSAYVEWAAQRDEAPLSTRQFRAGLRALGFVEVRRRPLGARMARGWDGIRLRVAETLASCSVEAGSSVIPIRGEVCAS